MTQSKLSVRSQSLMQKLLGRNYKWWFYLKYQIKNNTAYRWSTLLWMVGRMTVLAATILTWWININSGSNLFNFKEIFTYYIFGSIIAVGNGVHWNLSSSIKSGGLASRLLRPSRFMTQVFVSDFGWWLFPLCVEIFLLLLVAIVGREFVIATTPLNFIMYLICGVIGYFIMLLFAYILGSLAFFFTDIGGILDLQNQTAYFLSGRAIPLSAIWFLQPISFLPFAFTFYHPMQIYLGKYTLPQIIYTILGAALWCLILYMCANRLFAIGMKRNESVGL